ncbi:hypothetical protein [Halarcobacter sp.]|uniref:hypothetical protein n=1 Tax=Halarcobacter sp. TaxID=2321133 RepID=UPI002AA6ED48|nr:hypothetical protein [Halarcobacter sp.]
MLVLKIIAVAIALFLLFGLMMKLNEYAYKKYSYEFFTETTFGIYMTIYASAYIGYEWYISSLKDEKDILNGIVVMVISFLIFLGTAIYNIKSTKFLFGLVFTIIQAILFIPFCVIGLIVIAFAIAYFSQTKPVYQVNK